MKLRIMHVLFSEAWGGLELYSLQFIRKLLDNDIECVLYCLKNTPLEREAHARNVPVVTQHKTLSLFALRRYTHVHVHQRKDLPLIRLGLIGKDTPLIYSLYMNASPKHDAYHRWIYRRIDAIMSSSEWVCSEIKKNYPIHPAKIHLLRYGRDEIAPATEVTVAPIKAVLQHQSGRMVFGSMSRIDPGKGVQDILAALALLDTKTLQQIELWVIGEPTLKQTLRDGSPVYEKKSQAVYDLLLKRAAMDQYKEVIKVIPFQREYHTYLHCMDVFILASHCETYSLSVIDAMQCGLPVIGTRCGGTMEQIGKNQRGYLVSPRNAQEIANAIKYYVDEHGAVDTQGKAAREWANREHRWSHTIESVMTIYTEARRKESVR